MKFSVVALLPVAVMAGPNVFEKRAACNSASIVAGLQAIGSSVAALDAEIVKNAASPCTKVTNVASILLSVRALNSRISTEAAGLGACSPGVADCNGIQAEFTNGLIPKVTGLAKDILARSSLICNCAPNTSQNLGGVVRAQASSISSAVAVYSASVNAKAPCPALVAADVSTINSNINAVIKTIAC